MSLRSDIEADLDRICGLLTDLWPALAPSAQPARTAAVLTDIIAAHASLQTKAGAWASRIAVQREIDELSREVNANTQRMAAFMARAHALDAEVHDALSQGPFPQPPPQPAAAVAASALAAATSSSADADDDDDAAADDDGDQARRDAKLARRAATLAGGAGVGSLAPLYRTDVQDGWRPYSIPRTSTSATTSTSTSAADAAAALSLTAASHVLAQRPRVRDLLLHAETLARHRQAPMPGIAGAGAGAGAGPWPIAPPEPPAPSVAAIACSKLNRQRWPLEALLAIVRAAGTGAGAGAGAGGAPLIELGLQ